MTFISTLKENRAMIFTVVGCIGVTVTAALAAWGQYKADEVAQEYKKDISDVKLYAGGEVYCTAKGGVANELSLCELVLKTYKYYIPAVAVGGLTIASFLFGIRYSRIDGVKRLAPLPFPMIPKPEEQEVSDITDKDEIIIDPNKQIVIYDTGDGNQLFQDSWTGLFFLSDPRFIQEQTDEFKRDIDNGPGWACFGDYFKRIHIYNAFASCMKNYYFDTERGYLEIDTSTHFRVGNRDCIMLLYENGPFEPDTPELN